MLPAFWKYWMYYINPCTWWIRGVLSATLAGQPVQCAIDETAQFTPLAGQTCGQYAGTFATSAGGYLLDTAATDLCHYCPYTSGDQYLATLNTSPDEKWQDFGIFLAFVISNYALVYFFIWSVRIKGWSFGFGAASRAFGKGAAALAAPFSRVMEKRRAKKEGEEIERGIEDAEEKAEEG